MTEPVGGARSCQPVAEQVAAGDQADGQDGRGGEDGLGRGAPPEGGGGGVSTSLSLLIDGIPTLSGAARLHSADAAMNRA